MSERAREEDFKIQSKKYWSLRSLNQRIQNARRERAVCAFLSTGQFSARANYGELKLQYIKQTLDNPKIVSLFRQSKTLPQKFGHRLDERCVEYPWVLSRIETEGKRILDAGSALNYADILGSQVLANKKIDILTLAPEENCFWKKKVSYLYDDLRELPFKDDLYDQIVCISTIEHIGMNNTNYGAEKERFDNKSFLIAASEFKRVLKPGGKILITLPFGKYTDGVWFQQFDKNILHTLISSFKPLTVRAHFYQYKGNGWQISTEESCGQCEYIQTGIVSPQNFQNMHFIAPTASALACLEIR